MSIISRHAPYDARRGSHTLSLKTWKPRKSAQLCDGEQLDNTENPAELQRFETCLWDARNRWDIARRGGLLSSHRMLDKRDAERAWREYFGARKEVVE